METAQTQTPILIRLTGSDKNLDLEMSRNFLEKIMQVPGIGLFGTRICIKGNNHPDWVVLAEVVSF